MENKMKTYLGEKYNEDNHILNWLWYWDQGKDTSNQYSNQDEWRMANDLDCLYLDNLKADTIISIFQILKRVIMCINPKQKIKKDSESIKMIIDSFEQLLPTDDLLVQQLQLLANKAEMRSNFMLLPNSGMQVRGIAYADEMAPTLYQCFDGGSYSKYFTEEYTVEKWVKQEKLEMLLEDNVFDREHIKPTINGYDPKQSFKNTRKRDLILGVINYSNTFLDERAKYFE